LAIPLNLAPGGGLADVFEREKNMTPGELIAIDVHTHAEVSCRQPGGGGLRLKYSNPIHLDDGAVDFPDMTIIIAHPSWPWTDEALSIALH